MFFYLEICGLISLQIYSGHCLFRLLIDFEAGEIITNIRFPVCTLLATASQYSSIPPCTHEESGRLVNMVYIGSPSRD